MRKRIFVVTAVLVVVACGSVAVAARAAWPGASLDDPAGALARVAATGLAGDVKAVVVIRADGRHVPVRLRNGTVLPRHRLGSGQRLTVVVTVKRPGWAGWLVGGTQQRRFTIETPSAHLLGHWLQVADGAPVNVSFDSPVSLVSLGKEAPRRLATPQKVVPLGVVEHGPNGAGAIQVAAAARTWEQLPAPVRVGWFPARPYPQVLAAPRPGARISPRGELNLTFSGPVDAVLGSGRPRVSPAIPGRWRTIDTHTIAFQPSGLGFALGADVRIVLPRAVGLAGQTGTKLTRVLEWHVPEGSTLRLQQLLAQLGYLPVGWLPLTAPATTVGEQLAAAISPPSGRFAWRYLNNPPELTSLWSEGEPNDITRGAVMMFESTHDLAVDGVAGPQVWRAVIADALAGKRLDTGYSYVYVHRNVPQSLNLWHNGQLILSSPGNTGVPAAPTQLGTFPVFEHIPVGTMSGTNPNGTHYKDPGIKWISYFHGGDAIHEFNRSSFGTPQSLGCVELPEAAAAQVWPYTPIGTLVTIEN